MRDKSYTYEDYTKDFELDYLGFDGVSNEPGSDECPEESSGNKPKPDDSELKSTADFAKMIVR